MDPPFLLGMKSERLPKRLASTKFHPGIVVDCIYSAHSTIFKLADYLQHSSRRWPLCFPLSIIHYSKKVPKACAEDERSSSSSHKRSKEMQVARKVSRIPTFSPLRLPFIINAQTEQDNEARSCCCPNCSVLSSPDSIANPLVLSQIRLSLSYPLLPFGGTNQPFKTRFDSLSRDGIPQKQGLMRIVVVW